MGKEQKAEGREQRAEVGTAEETKMGRAEKPPVLRSSTATEGGKGKGTEVAELFPLPALAKAAGMAAWELAALMVFARWAEGKAVGQTEFDAAVEKLRKRPMGGGRI